MDLLQRCVFKRIFQHGQCYLGSQDATRSLASRFPSALLDGHRAAGHRSKSSEFESVFSLLYVLAHPLAPHRERPAGVPGIGERTLIAVKPDGVQRRLVGQIIQRFEQRGFKLVGLKMLQVSEDLLSQHYCELRKKPFYPSLQHYMTSGPVVVMVWEGHNVVQSCRVMVGHTNPAQAQAGTVRGDFSVHVSRNVVHASDSLEGAQREIQLWFQGKDLLNWDCSHHTSTYE